MSNSCGSNPSIFINDKDKTYRGESRSLILDSELDFDSVHGSEFNYPGSVTKLTSSENSENSENPENPETHARVNKNAIFMMCIINEHYVIGACIT